MHATASALPGAALRAAQPGPLRERSARAATLGAILLLHLGAFYALRDTLPAQVVPPASEPREVFVTFVTPPAPVPSVPAAPSEPAPAPPEPAPPIAKPAPRPVEPEPAPVVVKKPAPVVKKPAHAKPVPPKPAPEPVQEAAPAPAAAVAEAAPAPAPAIAPPSPVAAPAPAPAPPLPAQPRTVSGVEYIEPPRPTYPPQSRRMGEEGKVVLRILVNQAGRPERVEVQTSSGSIRLDEAARQAALRALFKPHRENGVPVAVYAMVPINFSLQ